MHRLKMVFFYKKTVQYFNLKKCPVETSFAVISNTTLLMGLSSHIINRTDKLSDSLRLP